MAGRRMCSRALHHLNSLKPNCCKYAMWCQHKESQDSVLVPLKNVSISGTLESGHATLNAELTYINLLEESPIEC
jgi:hypothetical protein